MTDTASKLYGGADPRTIANYAIAEVAGYLSVPRSKVRAWARDVIKLPNRSLFSFFNLVDVYLLAALRETHHGLPAIRTRIDYDDDALALRLYPFTRQGALDSPKSVVIDPSISFGRPVLVGTGIPINEIAARFVAGDTPSDLAYDFGVTEEQILEAVRCELYMQRAD